MLRPRGPLLLGLVLGAGFGLWNMIVTGLDPLREDTPLALLLFYGPMFAIWGLAGFQASRRTGRLLDAGKVGAMVAFATFVAFDLMVLLRVNLFLATISGRSDWQKLMLSFRASGFDNLRAYANYVYLTGAPLKILVASTVGAGTGLVGGFFAWLGREVRQIAQ